MLRLFAECGRLRSGSQPITDVSLGMPLTTLVVGLLTGSRGLTRGVLAGSAPPSSSSTTAANAGERWQAGKGIVVYDLHPFRFRSITYSTG